MKYFIGFIIGFVLQFLILYFIGRSRQIKKQSGYARKKNI